MERIAGRGIQVIVPPDASKRRGARPGWEGEAYASMRRLLATERGSELYRKRQAMVEPVFGQTKFNRTFDYREFAHVVRRRQAAMPAEERVRISEALRVVQKEIDHHRALLDLEQSAEVARAYAELLSDTRRVAGGLIRDSWENESGIDSDPQMNIADIDLQQLDGVVERYKAAVRRDLSWLSSRR